ncbi:trigger factor [Megalodesulfovibrio gigas]|uniref:Trigger factor n=1 Tax=Megalodesulfovibrio gigas (strain ATCC 19364 / DSM 1382 / NCIMB 9332 / VKM B-1759) TaxID=1121448 RepID=T2GCI0_MEGG1|nr:trigger factor [Megalodesulfovibrio gigas]AGW13889.1 putative trigger factor [Megalodesulfovibrio gigas DSM 1382 = ATCC 19364]
MEYTVEAVTSVMRSIKVHVSEDEVHASLAATTAMYRKDVDIKGFRKGKAPTSIIEGKFKKQIAAEATTDLVNLHINEILGELKVSPVSRIDFDGGEMEKGQTFDYTIRFEVMPEIELPAFEGTTVEEETPVVNEAEIEAVMDRIRNNAAEVVPVETPRKPVNGDIVVVSFKARKDGAVIPGLEAENFELSLGEGHALEPFEEMVKTLEPGQSTVGPMTFPDDFLNTELAGQTVEMDLTLYTVKEKKLPPLTDELAKKAGGFESVEKMREAITKSYMESRRQLHRATAQKKFLDALLAQVSFEIPPSLLGRHLDNQVGEAVHRAERQGKTLEAVTGMDPEAYRAHVTPQAEELARAEIFLLAVARKEGLEVTEQEVDFHLRQLAARMGQDFHELKQFYSQHGLIFEVRDKLLADKAMERMYSKVNVVEVPASAAEAQA